MRESAGKRDLAWLRQTSSFAVSRIVLTANNFRVFDHLEGKGKTAGDLAKSVSADSRAAELLLNSLVAAGLLVKKDSLYRNAPVASKYLIRGKPYYQGDILDHYSTLWDNWSGLDAVIKTGKPCRKSHNHESFILGMHNLALQKVREVTKNIRLSGVKRLLDLGGGPGTYTMAFARKNIEVTLLDFPETLRIAKRLIAVSGLGSKIKLLPGDFAKTCLGNNYDMVFISQILHAYNDRDCLSLLKKSSAALKPGGRVVVQEFYLDETKTNPPQGAIFAINMLVNTAGGRTYTPSEISSWMKKAGFTDITVKILGETVLISGTTK
jgi:ubiquinone/menaquinone biosynthesis C-methylase UbiE